MPYIELLPFCCLATYTPFHSPTVQERELGNDAFAQQRWDAALAHYTRALQLAPADPLLWSNRAAAYLSKGW
jgi:Flp pilus assembly protein TadD